MERKFIKDKIENNLIKKDFSTWTKHTIDYLVLLISIKKLKKYHTVLFLLFNDYIAWYRNAEYVKNDSHIYTLDELDKINYDLYLILYNNHNYRYLFKHSNKSVEYINNNSIEHINNKLIDKNNTYISTHKPIHTYTEKNRDYINDFGNDDIVLDNYINIDTIMFFIFFLIGFLIMVKFISSIYNNSNKIPSSPSINLNSILSGTNSNSDILNNPLVNYFINRLF